MDVGDKLGRVVIAGRGPGPRRVRGPAVRPRARRRPRGGVPGARPARRVDRDAGLPDRRGNRPARRPAHRPLTPEAPRRSPESAQNGRRGNAHRLQALREPDLRGRAKRCGSASSTSRPRRRGTARPTAPSYERRMIDAGWQYGSLTKGMEPSPPEPEVEMTADIAALLDEAEDIVNAAGARTARRAGAQGQAQDLPQAQEALTRRATLRFTSRSGPTSSARGVTSRPCACTNLQREVGDVLEIEWRVVLAAPVRGGTIARQVHASTPKLGAPGGGRTRCSVTTPWSGEHAPPSHSMPSAIAGKGRCPRVRRRGFDRFHLALMRAVLRRQPHDLRPRRDPRRRGGVGLDADGARRRGSTRRRRTRSRSGRRPQGCARARHRGGPDRCRSTTNTCSRAR